MYDTHSRITTTTTAAVTVVSTNRNARKLIEWMDKNENGIRIIKINTSRQILSENPSHCDRVVTDFINNFVAHFVLQLVNAMHGPLDPSRRKR